ncbi:MAG TPA: hypothetical protein VJ810_22725 [Blastocatellia bacterium]|nr:hypothetical protein [Blastocatellia bacterium]
MAIIIEPVTTRFQEAAMLDIRRSVFEQELKIALAPLRVSDNSDALHILAIDDLQCKPVATLSVVETTGDLALHQKCCLEFTPSARSARYTQLAVIRSYRGLNIPMKMMLEAHRLFVAPRNFEYTWLVLGAAVAQSSFLCTQLGFSAGEKTFLTEYGLCRLLTRDERMLRFEQPAARAAMASHKKEIT